MTELRGLRTYLYECLECGDGERLERLVRYAERDEQECDHCGETLVRRPSGAVMNTRICESFVDGTDRGDEWRKLKEANKIELESYDLPPEKRAAHTKEANKLKKVKK